MFADWAAGIYQPTDTNTIDRHVTAMVDSVYKHYDNNKDDYISKEEFEQIASNFPFMDSFVNIDADK